MRLGIMNRLPGHEETPMSQTATAAAPSTQKPALPHSPVVLEHQRKRAQDLQLRVADAITKFAGSMMFVYVHIVVFALWMIFLEKSPWQTLTLMVSLEAIFLSTFVMIGQNRQSDFQQSKADRDFNEQESELHANTDLTKAIHALALEIHNKTCGPGAGSVSDTAAH
jgi:uncharacterized membrane protein